MTDPIADFITRLRNASAAGAAKLEVPHSKIKEAIARILKSERLISDVTEEIVRGHKMLAITIPQEKATPPLTFVRISKPGRRMYVRSKDIPRPLKGYGLVVLSTPQGVMTGKEARRRGLGGEILFKEQ